MERIENLDMVRVFCLQIGSVDTHPLKPKINWIFF